MTVRVVLVSILLLVQAAPADAGSCRPFEYAELKEMATADLEKWYCWYTEYWTLERESFNRWLDMYRRWTTKDIEAKLNETQANSQECTDQLAKIGRMLTNRGYQLMPQCETKKP